MLRCLISIKYCSKLCINKGVKCHHGVAHWSLINLSTIFYRVNVAAKVSRGFVNHTQYISLIIITVYGPLFVMCCCGLVLVDFTNIPWWRHQMETFSALLALCAGNSPVTGEFPAQRSVTRSFDVFFDLRLNKRLSKLSWGWWFETLSHPLWRHYNPSGWLHWHWADRHETISPLPVY